MPKSNDDIVNEIASQLDAGAKSITSYSWKDFYKVATAEKLHKSKLDAISKLALDEHQIVIGYGHSVVIACRDHHHNRSRPAN